MDWSDEGIVLASRPHGETGLVVSLLTRLHGRHAGFVAGGVSRKARPIWQMGNVVEVAWRARQSEQLGYYTGELREAHAARAMDDAVELAGLSAGCGLIDAALPEREPHPAMFDGFHAFLGAARPSRLAGDLCPAGARPAAGAGLRSRPRQMRRDRRDGRPGLRLAQDRTGGLAGGRRPLQGEAAGAAGVSVHRRVAVG